MPPRKHSQSKQLDAKTSKRIVLPISQQAYQQMIDDCPTYRDYVDTLMSQCPELFPPDMQAGYTWHDIQRSRKMPEVRLRRIKFKQAAAEGKAQVWTLVPSFVMPYMTAYTDAVEKALFLRRFGVPYWALTYVFGHNDLYWQRLIERLGSYDLVGTTVKHTAHLPEHLLADEKHTRINGEKAFIATTVAADCVLGVSVALQADTFALTEAYGHFKHEACRLKPDYQPQTVNTDGWFATQNAWQGLFPVIVIIQCFLHAFISIRACCKRLFDFPQVQQRVWDLYHALTPGDFYRQVADLYAWAQERFQGAAWMTIQKLCAKTGDFLVTFDYPDAYRTSNMLDRHMEPMDRYLYSARYFHGHRMSAEFQIRGWALLHNFCPYCPRAPIRQRFLSPAHQLNGFVYHDNWLHNLLISTSRQVLYAHHKIR